MTDHDWNLLLDRYISGESSPDEQALVKQGLAERGESLETIEALRRARQAIADAGSKAPRLAAPPSADTAEALARLDQRLVDAGLRPAATPRLRLRLEHSARPVAGLAPVRARRWAAAHRLRAAAVAGLVLAGGTVTAWLMTRPRENSSPLAASAVGDRELVTSRGQRAVFRLVDGTEVMLGVDSRLRLPADYGAAHRDVWLEGEAYFTAAHSGARSFTVHTARGVTRDIGTRFGVRAYRQDIADRVAVAEGAVAVRPAGTGAAERRLVAGQLAVLSPGGAVAVTDSIDVASELAWTRGELRFANTPFGVAVGRLEQWYDIDVQLRDSALADRPVTGVYADEPLDQVLTLLTTAVEARFERHGKRVVISAVTGGRRS